MSSKRQKPSQDPLRQLLRDPTGRKYIKKQYHRGIRKIALALW